MSLPKDQNFRIGGKVNLQATFVRDSILSVVVRIGIFSLLDSAVGR